MKKIATICILLLISASVFSQNNISFELGGGKFIANYMPLKESVRYILGDVILTPKRYFQL
ncbi:MAG: hypothetical protein JXL97_17275, partial [Bacteroidales bacterium]|nr:hypothetical protein [Bacteroidales bacterium]